MSKIFYSILFSFYANYANFIRLRGQFGGGNVIRIFYYFLLWFFMFLFFSFTDGFLTYVLMFFIILFFIFWSVMIKSWNITWCCCTWSSELASKVNSQHKICLSFKSLSNNKWLSSVDESANDSETLPDDKNHKRNFEFPCQKLLFSNNQIMKYLRISSCCCCLIEIWMLNENFQQTIFVLPQWWWRKLERNNRFTYNNECHDYDKFTKQKFINLVNAYVNR